MPAKTPPLVVRPVQAHDDLQILTRLIHAAYAPHLAKGLRYVGTHQTVDMTAKRLARGYGFIGELGGEIVGTITLMPPRPNSQVPLYREPPVWSIGQFAVRPEYKGGGIGRALHDYALTQAMRHGAKVLALDTAEPAKGLITLYERWGYAVCGTCDWRPETNYLSVLMRRELCGI